jgi:hypothetical protein
MAAYEMVEGRGESGERCTHFRGPTIRVNAASVDAYSTASIPQSLGHLRVPRGRRQVISSSSFSEIPFAERKASSLAEAK